MTRTSPFFGLTAAPWRTIPMLAIPMLALVAVSLGACASTAPRTTIDEAVGFRPPAAEDVAAVRGFRACRDDALALDAEAQAAASPGRYLASARLLERCVGDLGAASRVAEDERMRAQALAVQNFLKGGAVDKAEAALEEFRSTFPERDLYYPGGASFVETMQLLLTRREAVAYGGVGAANVAEPLKDEMRRVAYWNRR